MLRIIALVTGVLMSLGVLAEDEQAGQAAIDPKQIVELKVLSQEENVKRYRADFDLMVREGGFKKAKESFKDGCMSQVGIDSYCSCAHQVNSEQTDEFLFHNFVTLATFHNEMKLANEAGDAPRYLRLRIQSTEIDSVDRRIAFACGVIDDATKTVIPIKAK